MSLPVLAPFVEAATLPLAARALSPILARLVFGRVAVVVMSLVIRPTIGLSFALGGMPQAYAHCDM